MMKSFLLVLLATFSFAVGWEASDLFRLRGQQLETKKDIDGIYEAITLNNKTQSVMLTHHGRLLHYISGHQPHNEFVKGCPECGLIEQLEIRRTRIYDRTIELAEFIVNNPNDSTIADKQKELEELNEEDKLATQKLFSADKRAKELSNLIKSKTN